LLEAGEYSALHITFYLHLCLCQLTLGHTLNGCWYYNLLLVMFVVIISAVWLHLQYSITALLIIPLLFDGFSKKEIIPQQCLQLVKNQEPTRCTITIKNFNSSFTLNPTCFGQVPDHLQGYTILKCYVHM
jgi:hypothetical protein